MALERLRIENFAIIERLAVEFQPGFTVLTGETGAGKSIIIDALSLALGDKASPSMIRAGADTATIECVFQQLDLAHPVNAFLDANELPHHKERIAFKRQLFSNGRSKAFINGKACTITILKKAGDLMVDLHGQHDHQSLLQEDNHIAFLDAYGDYRNQLEQIAILYHRLTQLLERHQLLQEKKRVDQEKRELWEYQLKEIEKVAPDGEEYPEMLKEKSRLENAEKIHLICSELAQQLYEDENSIYQQILTAHKRLSELNRIDSSFDQDSERLTETQYLLQELANQLARYGQKIEFDPLRLETVNQRLFDIQQLMKKYGGSIEVVIVYKDRLREQLEEHDGLDSDLATLTRQINALKSEYKSLAVDISQKRKQTAQEFQEQVKAALTRLGIDDSRFVVKIEQIEDPEGWVAVDNRRIRAEKTGIDRIVFEISTNPGEPLRRLIQIVSGGEVSRIMLAMKSILAGKDNIPVVIFDEIDTGISGKVARVVGEELRSLSQYHQVICITHLPQIAGLGKQHYTVYKTIRDGRSVTNIEQLLPEDRITEIAKLIGGKTITENTYKQARELIA